MHTAWIVVITLVVVALLNVAFWALARSQGYTLAVVQTPASSSSSS